MPTAFIEWSNLAWVSKKSVPSRVKSGCGYECWLGAACGKGGTLRAGEVLRRTLKLWVLIEALMVAVFPLQALMKMILPRKKLVQRLLRRCHLLKEMMTHHAWRRWIKTVYRNSWMFPWLIWISYILYIMNVTCQKKNLWQFVCIPSLYLFSKMLYLYFCYIAFSADVRYKCHWGNIFFNTVQP